jgi:hypothetical protein
VTGVVDVRLVGIFSAVGGVLRKPLLRFVTGMRHAGFVTFMRGWLLFCRRCMLDMLRAVLVPLMWGLRLIFRCVFLMGFWHGGTVRAVVTVTCVLSMVWPELCRLFHKNLLHILTTLFCLYIMT